MKIVAALAILALAQAVPAGEFEFVKPLSAIGLAGVIFFFYRQDRLASEGRYEKLAHEFRQIVENNTAAFTRLRDTCPLAHDEDQCRDR